MECGIFAHGFARAWCDDCGHDYFVAYSCKGRGVCPRATPGAWWRRRRTSATTSSPACRCASGCCLSPNGYVTSCSVTGQCSTWCCASSCGSSRKACRPTAPVRQMWTRRPSTSAPWRLSTGSAPA
ncbi:transposase zinc-binding domain-containing protein [Candidatus Aalborgicola defluviihabitans]|uniref:transposase zinc-binding domain-containing protein n=1 Tax=Candidatus Aalborgicola defluviihabitans TaxID=3386187 RepID=UPI0039B9B043